MAQNRNRHQLKSADGTVLGDIETPQTMVELVSGNNNADHIWKNWIYQLFVYIGIVNENFLTVEDWNAPTLINSWANVAGHDTAGYYIDPFGRVWLKGVIGTGTTNTVAFVLPSGYRPPSAAIFFPALQTSGAAGSYIKIDASGNVTPVMTGTEIHLNGMSFRI